MDEVVPPLLHKYAVPPEAVSVAFFPEQMVAALPDITAVTGGLTEIFFTAVSEHIPFDTNTEYAAALVGETTIGLMVAPVLHEYVPPPTAVSVALCPMQREVLAVLIIAIGLGFTVTAIEVLLEQFPEETITEYVVLLVGETTMDEVVAVVFHE